MVRVWLVLMLAACGGGATVCKDGLVACGDACVDLAVDPGHCGSCGHACSAGDVCSVGACAGDCLAGLTDCNGRCVDENADHGNCGACRHACASGQVCVAGNCGTSCELQTVCGDHCADLQSSDRDCGACGNACPQDQFCISGACTQSAIRHVVLIVEENHTFDTYFGLYCTAAAGSNPTCTMGAACCEGAPALEPGGAAPLPLTDASNETYDRDHDRVCEVAQIDGGLMDHYVTGSNVFPGTIEGVYTYNCSDPHNWTLADSSTVGPYWTYANTGALADRYFQPTIGSTSANDMYLAVAQWQFDDNTDRPFTTGTGCLGPGGNAVLFSSVATIADLLVGNGHTFRMYADGYADASAAAPQCASAAGVFPADCEQTERTAAFSTCNYDPSDLPFEYYTQFADNPQYLVDFTQFANDVAAGQLPSLAYVKARTYTNEHPKWSTISRGITFVSNVVSQIESSPYAQDTLILLVWDEGGGFFDHVPPPAPVDTRYDADGAGQPVPYGTRVPLLALGKFARAGTVSHVQLEHSSIVRFLEHNFLGPRYAGALGHRDAAVANLGSLLDPAVTGIVIP
jgi:phospholipase C